MKFPEEKRLRIFKNVMTQISVNRVNKVPFEPKSRVGK